MKLSNSVPSQVNVRIVEIEQTLQLKIRYFQFLWLQLHSAIYRPDSFVLMLCYCANLKAIRYESTSLKRIVADKLRV